MTLVVNLFGGPGTGKSTTAAYVFAKLKMMGVNAELVTEYAKGQVWEGRYSVLDNQIYIFGKQHHALFRVKNKVDVIITDSPLLLSLYYGKKSTDLFKQLVLETHNQYNNMNVFLKRTKPYNPKGRVQTEKKAKQIDIELQEILRNNNISTKEFTADLKGAEKLTKIIYKTVMPNG